MSNEYYCRICNIRKVQRPGDVCANCQDPYQFDGLPASNPGSSASNVPSYDPVTDSTQPGEEEQEESYAYTPSRSSSGRARRILNIPTSDPSSNPSSGGSSRQVMRSSSDPVVSSGSSAVQSSAPLKSGPVVAPAPSSTPDTSAQNTDTFLTEGVVRNVVEGKDPVGLIGRWFRSLFSGVPFCLSDEQTEFQVFSNWTGSSNASGHAADKVIAYGKITSGKPVQDNTVRIYGKRDSNNAIIATGIENTTDGTFTVFNPAPMPAVVVRIISLIVLILIFGLGYSATSMLGSVGSRGTGSSVATGIGNLLWHLVVIIICAALDVHFVKNLFQKVKRGDLTLGKELLYIIICSAVIVGLASQYI